MPESEHTITLMVGGRPFTLFGTAPALLEAAMRLGDLAAEKMCAVMGENPKHTARPPSDN